MYSPVSLKTSYLFRNNKCLDNAWNNYIIFTPYDEEKMKRLKRYKEINDRFILDKEKGKQLATISIKIKK